MTRATFDRFTPSDRGRFGDNEYRSSSPTGEARSDLIDVTLALHHETDKAVLVSQTGDERRAVWIPRSQCEMVRSGRQQSGYRRNGQHCNLDIVHLTLRQGLAKEKGLI